MRKQNEVIMRLDARPVAHIPDRFPDFGQQGWRQLEGVLVAAGAII
jgi:hypothetical protein